MAQLLHMPSKEDLRLCDARMATQRLIRNELARIHMPTQPSTALPVWGAALWGSNICALCSGVGCLECGGTGQVAR